MSQTSHSFAAHAFNPDFGSEIAEGTINLDRMSLQFQSELITLEIPLSRLQVDLGEDEDERIYFHDSAQPDWKIYTDDFSILNHVALSSAGGVREKVTAVASRRELLRRLKITAWCLGIFCAVAWVAWLLTGLMVQSLVRKIPPAWEQQFGDTLVAELQKESVFLDDSNQVARLAALAAPLMRVMPPGQTNLTFHITAEEEPNAMALPGGHVIVNTGLLQMTERPEELLGVIAHEVAHVTEKHGFRKTISAAGPFLIFGIFLRGGNGASGILSESSEVIVQQSFSQKYETEADDVGWKYLVAADIDPRGMIEMFQKLKMYEARDKYARTVPQAFRSHPALDKRIARLESKWKKIPRKDGFLELKPLELLKANVP